MRNRNEIRNGISTINRQIEELEAKRELLILEDIQFSDDEQWYTEEEETHEVSKRPKKSETFIIGRIHWKESIMDEDKPNNPLIIERSRIVKVNGDWKFTNI